MPEPGLPTNQIQDFVQVLRRKTWGVVLCGLAGFSVAVTVLCFVPPKYSSWTQVEVKEVRFEEDPLKRNPSLVDYKDLQNVGAQMLSTPNLIRVIKDELQWGDFLAVEGIQEKRQEYLDDVRKRTGIERARKDRDLGNDYIKVLFKDEDPKRAASFANKILDVWMKDRMSAVRDFFERELAESQRKHDKTLKDVTLARQNVSRWQESYKISPTQATNRRVTTNEDPIIQQYEKAKDEWVRVEAEYKVYEDKYHTALDLYASEPQFVQETIDEKTAAAMPQAEATKPLIEQRTKLRDEITKFKEEQKSLKPANKRYQLLQRDVDKREKEIKSIEEKLAAAGVVSSPDKPLSREVINQKKLALKEELIRAEGEYLGRKNQLRLTKDRLSQLEEDASKRAGIYERYNSLQTEETFYDKQYQDAKEELERKTNIINKVNSPAGNPYRILDVAVPSDKPVEPPVALFLIAGLVGGAGLGFGVVFLREFVRSTYRSVQDAAASLSIPVVGFVNRMATRGEIRRARRRQLFGVSVSLAIILFIGGSASLYLLQPKLLPAPMRAAIDSVKSKLK